MSDLSSGTEGTFLARGSARLAVVHHPGRSPGVMFHTGFCSNMGGEKAQALEAWARAKGHAFTRFDYQGHGGSSGAFVDGSIGLWLGDALAVLDAVTSGPQILVGSSMGGWMTVLVARTRPQRVAGLLGIASAPDFTQDLVQPRLPPEAQTALALQGVWYRPSEYEGGPTAITRYLLEEARQHLVLRREIPFDGPVRLIHGQRDEDVPWQTSLRLAECLRSPDVRLTLVKDGGHRLSRPSDIALIVDTLAGLVASCRI